MPYVLTPNMSLPVPVVGQEPGPEYAVDINQCMSLLDAHTHTPGSGVQITSDAIDINSDLTFNNQRLTDAKSVTFTAQGSLLPAISPDIGALYVSGVDLYYNDGSGNQIRITQSGGVNSGNGNISGLVPPASATYVAGQSTFVWESNVNTPAAMDNGPVTIREIAINPNGITINSPVALGADYSLTLPPALPTVTPRFLSIDTSGNIGASWQVDNSTLEVVTNSVRVKDLGITAAKIANLTITDAQISNSANIDGSKIAPGTIPTSGLAPYPINNPAALGEMAFNGPSGNFSTSSTGFVDVTNLSVTITTGGRPVMIMILSSQNDPNNAVFNSSAIGALRILRDVSDVVGTYAINAAVVPGELSAIDNNLAAGTGLPAGTYTYKLQAKVSSGSIAVEHCSIVAYEI